MGYTIPSHDALHSHTVNLAPQPGTRQPMTLRRSLTPSVASATLATTLLPHTAWACERIALPEFGLGLSALMGWGIALMLLAVTLIIKRTRSLPLHRRFIITAALISHTVGIGLGTGYHFAHPIAYIKDCSDKFHAPTVPQDIRF
jgi:hypothetical protein